MSNHRNELLDLHYATLAGRVLGARPSQSAAPYDAEPEAFQARQSTLRRLAASLRGRRTAARAETGRA